jgi:hypothetical protein
MERVNPTSLRASFVVSKHTDFDYRLGQTSRGLAAGTLTSPSAILWSGCAGKTQLPTNYRLTSPHCTAASSYVGNVEGRYWLGALNEPCNAPQLPLSCRRDAGPLIRRGIYFGIWKVGFELVIREDVATMSA